MAFTGGWDRPGGLAWIGASVGMYFIEAAMSQPFRTAEDILLVGT